MTGPHRTILLSALLAASASAQVAWEDLGPHFRKVRGINYVATYPSLNSSQMSPPYHGVATSTAMWWFYDDTPITGTTVHVEDQLDWLDQAGINTVRVFMSFPAWEHFEALPGPNEYIRRFSHFLTLCANRGIYCIPVVWDGTGALGQRDPVDGTVFGNLESWHINPGVARMQTLLQAGGGQSLSGTPAEQYLLDLTAAAAASPAFLMWNLMNEPAIDFAIVEPFLEATLAILHAAAPDQMTLFEAVFSAPPMFRLARDHRVDALGIHPYGSTRSVIEAMTWDAAHVPDPQSQTGWVQKPILATEIGSPGIGLNYRDALDLARGVPRTDIGPNETGIGFMPFVSNIGWDGGNYPFRRESGLFYGDGDVRDVDAVMAFVEAALADGIPQSQLFTPGALTAKSAGPGYIEQGLIPLAFDSYDEFMTLLWMPGVAYAAFSWEQYIQVANLYALQSQYVEGALFGSWTNGNPWNLFSTQPGYVVSPADRDLMRVYAQAFVPGGPLFGLWLDIFEYATGVPFDPANQQHVGLLSQAAFPAWANVLRPYFILQQGPY